MTIAKKKYMNAGLFKTKRETPNSFLTFTSLLFIMVMEKNPEFHNLKVTGDVSIDGTISGATDSVGYVPVFVHLLNGDSGSAIPILLADSGHFQRVGDTVTVRAQIDSWNLAALTINVESSFTMTLPALHPLPAAATPVYGSWSLIDLTSGGAFNVGPVYNNGTTTTVTCSLSAGTAFNADPTDGNIQFSYQV